MNIEIIDFFPITFDPSKDIISGTLKVKLHDFGINLLGVYISKHKKFWRVVIPSKKTIHHETGDSVIYPYISFEDREKQRELIDTIRQKSISFIESRIADTTKPIICPPKPIKTFKHPKPPIPKEKPSVKKVINPVETITKRKWMDPPKKPEGSRNYSKFQNKES